MSSIKSSPNRNNQSITHQITTQYHSPQGDRFKKLSRKNAIQDIQELHQSNNLENQLNNNRSPLIKKKAIHDIHENANKADRSLIRKYANHDIHNISDNISKERIGYDMFITKTAENIKSNKIMTPRHSSPTVLSPRISSMSIPQKILRQKNKINYPDPAESVQSLKKFEQIEDHPEYVVKLKRSEARMSIHSLHEDESKMARYPKYRSKKNAFKKINFEQKY